MGNVGQQKNNNTQIYGNLFLQLIHQTINAGEKVMGTIYLNLVNDFPGDLIVLQFIGKEKVFWKQIEGHGKYRTTTYYNDKQPFYFTEGIIQKFQGSYIGKGQYQFPFDFIIDKNIPGSFYYDASDKSAVVYYKFKVKLYNSANPNSQMKMIFNQSIIINSAPSTTTQSQQKGNKSKLQVCCCLQKGQAQINCFLEKNEYYANEEIKLVVDVNNSMGNIKFSNIQANLQKSIHLKATKINVGQRKFTFNITKSSSQEQVEISQQKQIKLSFLVPSDAQELPNYSGKLIQCQHYIQIYCIPDGCVCMLMDGCCGEFPRVTLPIQIRQEPKPLILYQFPPQFEQYRPQIWQPQLFQQMSLNFSDNQFQKNFDKNQPHYQQNQQQQIINEQFQNQQNIQSMQQQNLEMQQFVPVQNEPKIIFVKNNQ